MIVNGTAIAASIYEDVKESVLRLDRAPRLTILTCAPNFETQKYLALKKRKAQAVGIETNIIEFDEDITTEDVIASIEKSLPHTDGIILQLPFPASVATETVLATVPPAYDVDALNPNTTEVLSPVAAACREILLRHSLTLSGKKAVVIGKGRLVGVPVAKWLKGEGAEVTVLTKETKDIASYTKAADIIVCGAGSPGLIIPSMVKEGVIMLDAGTSEESGELRGDADPRVAEKALLFTPVPGGIGPITVACLFRNLITLALRH